MKKWLVIVGIIFLGFVGWVYVFIASSQTFVYTTSAKCTQEAAARFFINKGKWQQWWPGQKKDNNLYVFRNYYYRVNKIMLNNVDLTLSNKNDSVRGLLAIVGDSNGLTTFQWNSTFKLPFNPFARLRQYREWKNIESNIISLLESTSNFFDKQENIYGMKIQVETVKDSSLITYSRLLNHYPTTEEAYNMIGMIKEFIEKNGGNENNNPMMHVQVIGPTEFGVMVAVPTVGDLPSEGNFKSKKMVLGNILTGEVRGGIYKIIQAELELKNFATDFKRISPAIPYQSLITNRLLEPDTSKWITRLYYPIF
jgi:hypothetical protein